MINVSNEYKNTIIEGRQFKLKTTITFLDGSTLDLRDDDIFQGGMSFNEATSNSSSFQIGYAHIGSHKLVLNNFDGKFDNYDFTGATVVSHVGLQLSETVEYLKKGIFTVDDPGTGGNIITLECLDNMYLFEKPFSEVEITFPTNALFLLIAICTYCGVSLGTTTFDNYDYTINERPVDDALSCLDMVSYIAQVTGNYAKCNVDGELELSWYDTSAFEQEDSLDGGSFDSTDNESYQSGDSVNGGNFTDYTSGDNIDGGTFEQMKHYHHFFDFSGTPTVSVDDVVITGFKVVYTDKNSENYTAMYGSDGYVLSIENNPLIQSVSDANKVAHDVGIKIVGMKFRPFSANVLSDPSVQAGDPCIISIRTSRGYVTYQSFLTSLTYTVGQRISAKCNAETPSRRSSIRYSATTKSIVQARQIARQQLSAYDIQAQKLTSLIANGYGLYMSDEILEDGSKKYYAHNKPTRAESDVVWTLTDTGLAISKDGGVTWGVDTNGNMLVSVLTAIGINAEWIVAGEIRGIKITTQSGQIGPFVMSASGLTSKYMQFFDDGNYPLIWLTKPGESDGGPGTEGYARANYEPSVTRLSSVEDGVETVITIMSRKAGDTGISGTIEIVKSDASTGLLISEQIIRDGEMIYREYEPDGYNFNTYIYGKTGILISSQTSSIHMFFDADNGSLYCQADNIHLNGNVFINGQPQ